jgi:predicted DNA binding CopG/RHH family protein
MKRNKKMTSYTDEPIQMGARVADFLPSPAQLAEAEEVVKVTLSLSKQSVEFFKREAEEHNMPYQRMIRRLLDEYVANQPVERQ